MRVVRLLPWACVAAWLLAAGHAKATYSILAVDMRDGSVGGAVASCVPLDTVERVYGAVPGRGAIVTQSFLKDEAHPDALALLAEGRPPADVLGVLVDSGYDPAFQQRQYAVVDVAGAVASFTGTDALAVAAGTTFEAEGFVVAVQGNLLTDGEVLAQARAAFTTGGGCDLAGRLIVALEAAGANGRGDARCAPDGVPAKAATLEVDPPGAVAGSFLRLTHESPGDRPVEDPVAHVRVAFDAWRVTHPCPETEQPADPPGTPSRPAEQVSPSSGCSQAPGHPGILTWLLGSVLIGLMTRRMRPDR
jgi:uncharacterized Ntn-hydrolase superfamily protein